MELDCTIYVATSNRDIVSKRLLRDVPGAFCEGEIIHLPSVVVEWGHNDYEGTAESEADFIGWPSLLDCQPTDSASLGEVVDVVSAILTVLWGAGIRAVAACDYEHLLPCEGGAAP